MPAVSARRLLEVIQSAGHDAVTVAAELGIPPLSDDAVRVPLAAQYRLWDEAVARTGDRKLPLSIARTYDVATYEVLGFACATAPDLATAYRRMGRFFALWVSGECARLCGGPGAQRIVFHHELGRSRGRDLAVESSLAKIVFAGRRATGIDIAPKRVHFAHPAPRDPTPHLEFFGGPVQWLSSGYQIEFDDATLALPMRRADTELAEYFEGQAARLLPDDAGEPTFADQVRSIVGEHLPSGAPAEAEVAAALGMSARTMRRRLAREETSYRKVLDDVRSAIARDYLETGSLSVADVAYLVGFSDVANFHRAFRRWTGITPGAFRASRRA